MGMPETFRLIDRCPGSASIRTPTLQMKKCPRCGEEIEIFSNEVSAACGRCGLIIYNDQASCIRWCRYAEECVGPEIVRKFREAEKKEGDEISERRS
jgi:ribosomal protein S27AE